MQRWKTKFYCQNFSKHPGRQAVLVYDHEKCCPVCMEALDWVKAINGAEACVSFPHIHPVGTYPIYPVKAEEL